MRDIVNAWAETVIFPTYKVSAPDKNPMFLEKRVYQGSSGGVYPHPVIDQILDEKFDQEYTALFLENRYLKIMVLPELGGRLQMALDKTNGYHFVYYNRVIKPALVGLAGPWISGGIEFNWPQHHRPSTFDPLDWLIEAGPDGSQTVWCAEIERMFHTKGMHGFRLYPERAYLEILVQLSNRTPLPQTFLWWANPAVSVHDETQSIFPPDVHAVMDHGKRDVSSFPIATGVYYKVDYAPGTDISRYKNIPVPTSYMAYHSDFDFMGNYDHRQRAGMLHIADHHWVPGKKQWTWGNGDFGKAWDRQLTDEDGPYIELMCGAFTDNQPDFSWIQPGEERSFRQVFMPYKEIGPVCNANEQVAVSLQIEDRRAYFGVYATSPCTLRVELICQGRALYDQVVDLNPEQAILGQASLPPGALAQELALQVYSGAVRLLSYSPLPDEKPAIPQPAAPARPPQEIESLEELYLNGLHLEQYRHATFSPEPYYQEALRRDPGDARCNNALGLLCLRRGQFSEARDYFRISAERQTLRNPNPYDGEAFYNLGLAYNYLGQVSLAKDAFYKATWNAAWQDAAYFSLARLACLEGDARTALAHLESCLARNSRCHKARHLKIALLRHAGQPDAARREIIRSLELDPLEYGALWERFLLDGVPADIIIKNIESLLELVHDYTHAGLFSDALQLLESSPQQGPLAAYLRGWVLLQAGRASDASQAFRHAATLLVNYCFPNRVEDVLIFEAAQLLNPGDSHAPYLLGNFYYAHRRHADAISCWERSAALEASFPTVWRNLGLAYYNQRHDPAKALACFEKAFALDPTDARIFFELDQLYKRLNNPSAGRLERLLQYPELVAQRDDLTIELIGLLNFLNRPAEAYQMLMVRNFHPWEGGEGKVTGQYVTSLVELARASLSTGDAAQAIVFLNQAQVYPPNLGEGKLYGTQENNIDYYLGCAYEMLDELKQAQTFFTRASHGLSEPTSALYYNDQPPEMIYYQGLALEKLGRVAEAQEVFARLATYGAVHLDDDVKIDYFAVSLPDFLVFDVDMNLRNRVHCLYMLGLGKQGLGEMAAAQEFFTAVLELDANHLGAELHRRLV
jgi:tetratricopeptide (TPR) repeat protein